MPYDIGHTWDNRQYAYFVLLLEQIYFLRQRLNFTLSIVETWMLWMLCGVFLDSVLNCFNRLAKKALFSFSQSVGTNLQMGEGRGPSTWCCEKRHVLAWLFTHFEHFHVCFPHVNEWQHVFRTIFGTLRKLQFWKRILSFLFLL